MKSIYIESFYGFGDCLYERPFVAEIGKHYERVYLRTFFPQLYYDQPHFRFLRPPRVGLQLQNKNADHFQHYCNSVPDVTDHFSFRQCRKSGNRFNAYHVFSYDAGFIKNSSVNLKIPLANEWKIRGIEILKSISPDKKLCIFRPPTIQSGFPCQSRNPDIDNLREVLAEVRKEYFVLAVGNYSDRWERPIANFDVDESFLHGEIDIWSLLGLMCWARLLLSGPSFFVPFAILRSVLGFFVYGHHEPPSWHILPRALENGQIGYIEPLRNDSKKIPDAARKYRKWKENEGWKTFRRNHGLD